MFRLLMLMMTTGGAVAAEPYTVSLTLDDHTVEAQGVVGEPLTLEVDPRAAGLPPAHHPHPLRFMASVHPVPEGHWTIDVDLVELTPEGPNVVTQPTLVALAGQVAEMISGRACTHDGTDHTTGMVVRFEPALP